MTKQLKNHHHTVSEPTFQAALELVHTMLRAYWEYSKEQSPSATVTHRKIYDGHQSFPEMDDEESHDFMQWLIDSPMGDGDMVCTAFNDVEYADVRAER